MPLDKILKKTYAKLYDKYQRVNVAFRNGMLL